MRVIVTGGAGRLGRSVVAGLRDHGHDVVSVDRDAGPSTDVTADLTDDTATRELFLALRPDAVVHLAAIAVPFSAPEEVILRTNSGLVMSVLAAAVAAGATRVLSASSPTVMGYGAPAGWQPHALPIDETHPPRPWNAYALSKLAIEETSAMFARAHPRIVFGAFRPCFVISPEEWEGAPTQQGHTVQERLADPSLAAVSLFNYVDARDAADFVAAWLAAAGHRHSGHVYFVGAADALCRDDVRAEFTRAFPDAPVDTDALASDSALFSSQRAADELGWHPTRSWRTELRTTEPTATLDSIGI